MNPPDRSAQTFPAALQSQAAAAVQSHRRKIQAFTIAAFTLGFLAVAASITIVTLNEMYVRPRQEMLARQSRELAWPGGETAGNRSDPQNVQARILALEIQAMSVVSIGSMMVAGSVGLLGLGTLLLVAAVSLNRRATLHQVNASLAHISAQLGELRLRHSANDVRSD